MCYIYDTISDICSFVESGRGQTIIGLTKMINGILNLEDCKMCYCL